MAMAGKIDLGSLEFSKTDTDKVPKRVNLNFQVKISFNPNEELTPENLNIEVVDAAKAKNDNTQSKNESKKPNDQPRNPKLVKKGGHNYFFPSDSSCDAILTKLATEHLGNRPKKQNFYEKIDPDFIRSITPTDDEDTDDAFDVDEEPKANASEVCVVPSYSNVKEALEKDKKQRKDE